MHTQTRSESNENTGKDTYHMYYYMYNVHHMESIEKINQELCANAVPVSVIINFKQMCRLH